MTEQKFSLRRKAVALALALGLAITGFGSQVAVAADPVGLPNTPSSQQEGTNNLKITLHKGNPDDNTGIVHGTVVGVTIHLDRLANIDATVESDVDQVRQAGLEDVEDWAKDLRLAAVTDSDGVVRFNGLEPGIYLVYSTAPSEEYREINSFLVSVPFYTVVDNPNPVEGVIVAKSHTPAPPTETTEPTEPSQPTEPEPTTSTPEENLAVTGVQLAGMVFTASALIGGGFVLVLISRRKNAEGEGH